MTTATISAKAATKKTTRAARELPGGYAGQLLRVDLTKKKCWAEPWGPDAMRELLGGVGLGAMILYRETAARGGKGNVAREHPDNPPVLATWPTAGVPAGGARGRTCGTNAAGTESASAAEAH